MMNKAVFNQNFDHNKSMRESLAGSLISFSKRYNSYRCTVQELESAIAAQYLNVKLSKMALTRSGNDPELRAAFELNKEKHHHLSIHLQDLKSRQYVGVAA